MCPLEWQALHFPREYHPNKLEPSGLLGLFSLGLVARPWCSLRPLWRGHSFHWWPHEVLRISSPTTTGFFLQSWPRYAWFGPPADSAWAHLNCTGPHSRPCLRPPCLPFLICGEVGGLLAPVFLQAFAHREAAGCPNSFPRAPGVCTWGIFCISIPQAMGCRLKCSLLVMSLWANSWLLQASSKVQYQEIWLARLRMGVGGAKCENLIYWNIFLPGEEASSPKHINEFTSSLALLLVGRTYIP